MDKLIPPGVTPAMWEEAPRPWVLVDIHDAAGGIPHIRAHNGRVVARAEGNIWVWQDFIAPIILHAVNRLPQKGTEEKL